jgi:hypothetical protein
MYRDPSCSHVNDNPDGTKSGGIPDVIVSNVNSNTNEFAAGLIDAVAYDDALVPSYALVRRVAPIAT